MCTMFGWVLRIVICRGRSVVVYICRGRSIQNMNAIVETGRCIHGVVVFNGLLCYRVYGIHFVEITPKNSFQWPNTPQTTLLQPCFQQK